MSVPEPDPKPPTGADWIFYALATPFVVGGLIALIIIATKR